MCVCVLCVCARARALARARVRVNMRNHYRNPCSHAPTLPSLIFLMRGGSNAPTSGCPGTTVTAFHCLSFTNGRVWKTALVLFAQLLIWAAPVKVGFASALEVVGNEPDSEERNAFPSFQDTRRRFHRSCFQPHLQQNHQCSRIYMCLES